MIKNNRSINNITNNQEPVNTDNIPVCPAVLDKNGKPLTGEPGSKHTSRSGKTQGVLRARYQNAKKRYRRV